MGQTITEKIISYHTTDRIEIGNIIRLKLDLIIANDITGPIAIDEFEKIGKKKVFNKDKIIFIPDHFTPNKDIESAELCKKIRKFSNKQNLKYYEVGSCGIEHAFIPEQGFVLPGDTAIGGDSHTCTYGAVGAFSTGVGSTDIAVAMATGEVWIKIPESMKIVFFGNIRDFVCGKDIILYTIGNIGLNGAFYKAIEFSGEIINNITMDDKFTICNMAIEAGAKSGIIEPDTNCIKYISKRANRSYKIYRSDQNAEYSEEIQYDVTDIEPQVAFPYTPDKVKPVSEAAGIPIDQVVIGGCTNGRIEDMRNVAKILKGKKICSKTRTIIIPATQQVFLDCIKEGLLEIFVKAGAYVSGPTCGPCIGGHLGVLGKNETCISTTNRNFVGRMGHAKSKVYLASPFTAAATAIKGAITDPKELDTIIYV